ncbi:MAG: hypothetical protein HYS13_13525 [Planctomycetia bacterium]|nr:hypothetical protein [Planctomycetia bacterium]
MATLKSLEQRVAALEQELTRLKANLRAKKAPVKGDEPAPEESLGEQLIREARQGHAEFVAGWAKFLEEQGIRGKPIGARKLRELLIAEGWDPNDNSASRELVAMRGE